MGYVGRMRHDRIVERVRALVERHALPDLITGFEVRFGEFDEDPAMWVVFKRTPGPDRMTPELTRRIKAVNEIECVLQPELLDVFEDGSVYFWYETDRTRASAAE